MSTTIQLPCEYQPVHVILPSLTGPNRDLNGYLKATDDNRKHLFAISKAAKESDSILYRVIRQLVGDCHAYYQITKVEGKRCHLKYISGIGDEVYSPVFGCGGVFPMSIVKRVL